MKIESSTVNLAAQSQSVSLTKASFKRASFRAPAVIMMTTANQNRQNPAVRFQRQDNQDFDFKAQQRSLNRMFSQAMANEEAKRTGAAGLSDNEPIDELTLLERMLQQFLGKHFKLRRIQLPTGSSQPSPVQVQTGQQGTVIAPASQVTVASSIVEHYEAESVSFSAEAKIQTADGRTIDFTLNLNMSRELYQKMETQMVSVTQLKDPLVINFGSSFAGLTSDKMTFDLDCDGTPDQVSRLASGSGFLALDLNGDGKVNDGNELFGTKSGDGFADLAKYDGDGNGWIDENDAIFDKLRIWMHNEDGTESLVAIGEMGIGAVYLGNVETNFSLKDGTQLNGMIRKTGIFLFENGSGGTVQHVDLAL